MAKWVKTSTQQIELYGKVRKWQHFTEHNDDLNTWIVMFLKIGYACCDFMMRKVHFNVVNNKVVLHTVKDVHALTYTIQLKDSWIMQKS